MMQWNAKKKVEDINQMSVMRDAIEELRRMVEAFEESFIIVELKLGLWLSLVKYYNHIASWILSFYPPPHLHIPYR